MNRKPKRRRAIESQLRARHILADNVKGHMQRRFRQHTFISDQAKALAKLAGVGDSTVMRILRRDRSTTLDTIERIARALKVSPHSLLIASSARR